MVALANSFAQTGLAALRIDLPFRQGRTGPPNPAIAARDREGLRAAAEFLRRRSPLVFLAGHSYGGRQASMLSADDSGVCAALLLLSYPLHPPKNPANARTGHFDKIRSPCLFIHGTRDPFGTPDELDAAVRLIPGPASIHLLKGAGHELKPVVSAPGDVVELFLRNYLPGRSATQT